MAIWGDYHTHSIYSHGAGTVEDNVRRAVELGLKEIGITDHGICNYPNNLPPNELDDFLSDINECREKYPGINIYAGIEANLLSNSGKMDLSENEQDKLDYIICGYHSVRIMMVSPNDFFTMFLPNLITKNLAKRIVKNTDAYINAMREKRVAIIAHPLKHFRCDMAMLCAAAKEYNVHIEVNDKNMVLAPADFEVMHKSGCKLIIVSDAHSPDKIGQITTALAASRAAGIPDDAYSNWEKFPNLRFNPKTIYKR